MTLSHYISIAFLIIVMPSDALFILAGVSHVLMNAVHPYLILCPALAPLCPGVLWSSAADVHHWSCPLQGLWRWGPTWHRLHLLCLSLTVLRCQAQRQGHRVPAVPVFPPVAAFPWCQALLCGHCLAHGLEVPWCSLKAE